MPPDSLAISLVQPMHIKNEVKKLINVNLYITLLSIDRDLNKSKSQVLIEDFHREYKGQLPCGRRLQSQSETFSRKMLIACRLTFSPHKDVITLRVD